MITSKKTARIAGILYLLLIVFGIFAELVVRSNNIVWDDATTTANNILSSEVLFRFGFVCDLLQTTFWLLLPLALYVLLKEVNIKYASIMVIFVMVGAAIQYLNLLNQFASILILKNDGYMTVFDEGQINALALFFLNLHKYGYISAGLFHGLWLLPLGLLVIKANYIPKIFGYLLILACIGFVLDFLGRLLLPGFENYTVPVSILGVFAVIGEFSFCAWLLIKGVRNSD